MHFSLRNPIFREHRIIFMSHWTPITRNFFVLFLGIKQRFISKHCFYSKFLFYPSETVLRCLMSIRRYSREILATHATSDASSDHHSQSHTASSFLFFCALFHNEACMKWWRASRRLWHVRWRPALERRDTTNPHPNVRHQNQWRHNDNSVLSRDQ